MTTNYRPQGIRNDFVPKFNEHKTTEAAAILLRLGGGRMSYMKLLKLLYLADRLAYYEWERPITYDHYVSMGHGQVPSKTYDLVRNMVQHGESFWDSHFTKVGYVIEFSSELPELRKLSKAEVDLLTEIHSQYGHLDRFELGEITHNLPEYTEPSQGGMIPTPWQRYFEALDFDQEDANRILSELHDEAYIDALFGK